MTKFITDFLLIIFTMLLSFWFYWHNQHIILTSEEYKIKISYLAIAIISLAIFICIYRSINFLKWLKSAPSNFYLSYKNKNNQTTDLMIIDLLASNISCGPDLSLEKAKKLAAQINTNKVENDKKYHSANILCQYIIASDFINNSKLEEAYKIIKSLLKEANCQYFSHILMAKLKMANNLYSEAIEYCKTLLDNDFKTKELFILAIDLYLKTNNINKIEELTKNAVEYKFLTSAEANKILEDAFFARAKEFFAMGKMDDALILAKKTLKLNLSNHTATILCIKILTLQNQSDNAWQIIEKIFRYAPSQQISDLLLELYNNQNDLKDKIDLLNKINPDSIFPNLTYIKFLVKNNINKKTTINEVENLISQLPKSAKFSHHDVILYLLECFN